MRCHRVVDKNCEIVLQLFFIFTKAAATATTGNDGSRFYASPMNVGPITGDQLTLSMWIKPDATQTNANAVFVRNGLSADGNYYSYFNNTKSRLYTFNYFLNIGARRNKMNIFTKFIYTISKTLLTLFIN